MNYSTDMDKTVNQHLIKVSGKSFIDKSPALGEEVVVILKGTVVKVDHCDNQDGTMGGCPTYPTAVEVEWQGTFGGPWPGDKGHSGP